MIASRDFYQSENIARVIYGGEVKSTVRQIKSRFLQISAHYAKLQWLRYLRKVSATSLFYRHTGLSALARLLKLGCHT